jgi:hypothetical protein
VNYTDPYSRRPRPVPTGDATVEGVIRACFWRKSEWHPPGKFKIEVRSDEGWICEGSLPRHIVADLELETTNSKPARARNRSKTVGRRIRLDATFKPREGDSAYFDWPKNARLL